MLFRSPPLICNPGHGVIDLLECPWEETLDNGAGGTAGWSWWYCWVELVVLLGARPRGLCGPSGNMAAFFQILKQRDDTYLALSRSIFSHASVVPFPSVHMLE